MIRWIPAAAIATFVLSAPVAYGQGPAGESRPNRSAFPAGVIEGRVLDDSQIPVVGAMVSVVGRTTAAATTDREGRYALRELPYGPYILSVHSRGYFKSRGRTVQITTSKVSIPEIQLAKARKTPVLMPATIESAPPPQMTQLAGFGVEPARATETTSVAPSNPGVSDEEEEAAEQGETAWRLRHLPRSILKDAAADAAWAGDYPTEPARWYARQSGALVPIAFFSDLPLSGQVNLMTIESFDRPREIFAAHAALSDAFVSVNAQASGGAWAMQGAMTRGDLSSWMVAG